LQTAAETSAAYPQRLTDDLAGLHNVLQVSEGILSGSEPHGAEGFCCLATLGVKTIVSVDGARPRAEEARKNGIRYVHIPIGYDGIAEPARLALARVAREAEGPVYFHCHHGRHRGPAAAAVACLAAGKASGTDALKILELAGTGQEYAGLWRDVQAYVPPPANAVLPELVEVAQVESLASAMAAVGRHWDHLQACREANWRTPDNHPDLVPTQEALLLREMLHEAGRAIPGDKFDERFRQWLDEAETLASEIEADVKQSRRGEIENRTQLLDQACKRCHRTYRD
jgi:hypothetical protein